MAHLILSVFIIISLAQLFIWILIFSKLIWIANPLPNNSTPKVTIVICTKNRLENIKSNLPSILDQGYKNLSILLVDDFSDAPVNIYLNEMQQSVRALTIHKVRKNSFGKKQALKEAFVKIMTDWILLTDDDCYPNSSNWAKSMICTAQESKCDIIIGYSPYVINNSVLSKWVHFEAWITGVQYLSYAVAGLPYMGVGRNLLYNRNTVGVKQIESHIDIISGDDDLTVNAVANRNNTSINLAKEAFVWSTPPQSFFDYVQQKRRHYSVSHRYKTLHKIAISAYTLSQVGFHILFLVLLFTNLWKVSVMIYTIRLIIIMPIIHKLYKRMLSQTSIFIFPLMDMIQAFFYVFFSFALLFPKNKKW